MPQYGGKTEATRIVSETQATYCEHKINRCAFMECICTDKPDPKCWQYDHHREHAGESGAFPKEAFQE